MITDPLEPAEPRAPELAPPAAPVAPAPVDAPPAGVVDAVKLVNAINAAAIADAKQRGKDAAADAEALAAQARAVEFARALYVDDDFPLESVRAESGWLVAIALDEEHCDTLLAAIYSAPSRKSFRDVQVVSRLSETAVKFEREAPEVVVARERLWRILRQLEDEISQCNAAKSSLPKNFPGERPVAEWLGRLLKFRQNVSRLHAQCYSNTLMETYDRVMANCHRRAILAARAAGLNPEA